MVAAGAAARARPLRQPRVLLVPGAVGTAVALALHGRPLVVRALPLLLGMAVTLYTGLVAEDGAGGAAPAPAWVGLALVVVATVWLGFGLHAWWRRWGRVRGPATSTRRPAHVARPRRHTTAGSGAGAAGSARTDM